MALFEFDRRHKVVPDEETVFSLLAEKVLERVESGKEKVKNFL